MSTDKNAMALYVRVVECGSFSKAASRTRVPVSTVSRKIADLESALGVRLLERSTRQLRMTEVGRDYFELCRRGLEAFDAADALVTDHQEEISGRLRISVPPSMSDIVILPLVSAFREKYPRAQLYCVATERLIDHIADGIDLSLRIGDPKDSSLISRPVATHRSKLVVTPRFLSGIGELSHPANIIQHVYVAFSRGDNQSVRWSLRRGGDSLELTPEPQLMFNEYGGVMQALLNGLGISEVPSFVCEAALLDGRLVEVFPEWRFPTYKLSVTYPSGRHLSPLVRAFKDFCISYFERKPLE